MLILRSRSPNLPTLPKPCTPVFWAGIGELDKEENIMKHIGSQTRETLKESGHKLVSKLEGVVILENPEGKKEVWYANDHHAGYTIQVGRWGYEFGRDYPTD